MKPLTCISTSVTTQASAPKSHLRNIPGPSASAKKYPPIRWAHHESRDRGLKHLPLSSEMLTVRVNYKCIHNIFKCVSFLHIHGRGLRTEQIHLYRNPAGLIMVCYVSFGSQQSYNVPPARSLNSLFSSLRIESDVCSLVLNSLNFYFVLLHILF